MKLLVMCSTPGEQRLSVCTPASGQVGEDQPETTLNGDFFDSPAFISRPDFRSQAFSMSTLAAPPGGDRNRATELNAFAWTWFSLSTVFVAGRVYSRLALTRNLWFDDYFIVLTWVCTYLIVLSERHN